jgi:hypothetical protein
MPRRGAKQAFDRIVEVRDAQRFAAESAAARAAADLERLERRRADDQATRDAQVDQWKRAMTDASLGLGIARVWTGAVAASEGGLRRLDVEIDNAEVHLEQRRDAWRLARAHTDVAQDLALKATRGEQRRRESAALNELADRMTRRKRHED